MSEQLVAFLIHGTFAKKAKWIQEDSPLAEALRRLPGMKRVIPFKWSGCNTFKARLEASEELAKALTSLDAGTKAVLCAHSHGGAVVCYAIQKNPDLARKVHAAVFLATPFVSTRLLPNWKVLHSTWTVGFEIFFLATIYLIGGLHVGSLGYSSFIIHSWDSGHLLLLMLLAGFSELTLQFVLWLNRGRQKTARKQLREAQRKARETSCELPSNLNARFVRLSGDEASTALVFSQGAAWAALNINALFSRVFAAASRPVRAMRLRHPIRSRLIFFSLSIFVLLTFFELRVLYQAQGHDAFESQPGAFVFAAAVAGLFIFVVVGLAYWIAFFLWILNWILAMPVGIVPPRLALCLQFSVEAVPPGDWTLSNITWRTFGVSKRPLFWRHSEAYNNSHAIDEILTWIRTRS